MSGTRPTEGSEEQKWAAIDAGLERLLGFLEESKLSDSDRKIKIAVLAQRIHCDPALLAERLKMRSVPILLSESGWQVQCSSLYGVLKEATVPQASNIGFLTDSDVTQRSDSQVNQVRVEVAGTLDSEVAAQGESSGPEAEADWSEVEAKLRKGLTPHYLRSNGITLDAPTNRLQTLDFIATQCELSIDELQTYLYVKGYNVEKYNDGQGEDKFAMRDIDIYALAQSLKQHAKVADQDTVSKSPEKSLWDGLHEDPTPEEIAEIKLNKAFEECNSAWQEIKKSIHDPNIVPSDDLRALMYDVPFTYFVECRRLDSSIHRLIGELAASIFTREEIKECEHVTQVSKADAIKLLIKKMRTLEQPTELQDFSMERLYTIGKKIEGILQNPAVGSADTPSPGSDHADQPQGPPDRTLLSAESGIELIDDSDDSGVTLDVDNSDSELAGLDDDVGGSDVVVVDDVGDVSDDSVEGHDDAEDAGAVDESGDGAEVSDDEAAEVAEGVHETHKEHDGGMPKRPDRKKMMMTEYVTPVLKGLGTAGLATAGFMTADWFMGWSQIIGSSPIPDIPNSMWMAKYAPIIPTAVALIPGMIRLLTFGKVNIKIPKKKITESWNTVLQACRTSLSNEDIQSFLSKRQSCLEEGNIDQNVAAVVRNQATKLKLTPASVPDFSRNEMDRDRVLHKYAMYCFHKLTNNFTGIDAAYEDASIETIESASWELARAIHHTHLKQARARNSYLGGGASLGAALAIGVHPIVPIVQGAVHLGRWYWNRKPAPDIQFSRDHEGNEVAYPVGVITEVRKNKRKSPPSGKLYTTPLLEKGGSFKVKEASAVEFYLNHDALRAPETILEDSSIHSIVDVAAVLEHEVLEDLMDKSGFAMKPEDSKKGVLEREYAEAKTELRAKQDAIKVLEEKLRSAQRDQRTAQSTISRITDPNHRELPRYHQMLGDATELIEDLSGPDGQIEKAKAALDDPDTGERAAFEAAKSALRKYEHPPTMKIVNKTSEKIKEEVKTHKEALLKAKREAGELENVSNNVVSESMVTLQEKLTLALLDVEKTQQVLEEENEKVIDAKDVLRQANAKNSQVEQVEGTVVNPSVVAAQRRLEAAEVQRRNANAMLEKLLAEEALTKARDALIEAEEKAARAREKNVTNVPLNQVVSEAQKALTLVETSAKDAKKKWEEATKNYRKVEKEIEAIKAEEKTAANAQKKTLVEAVKEAQSALDKVEAQVSIYDDAVKKAFAIRCHQIWEEIEKKRHDSLSGKVTDLAKTIGNGSATVAGLAAATVVGSAASGGIAAAMLGFSFTTGAMLTGGAAFAAMPLLGAYALWRKKGEIPKYLGKGVVEAYKFGAGSNGSSSHTASEITKSKSESEKTTPSAGDHH